MTSVLARHCLPVTFAAVAVMLPSLALAHPGHSGNDLFAGLLHPLTGLDHLLAMIAVGVWAARLGRGAVWTLPTVFPLAMMVGALLAMQSFVLPAIEPMIAVSVTVLGLLVACGVRLPLLASALLVGLFAIFHGYAHTSEAPVNSTMIPFAVGFIVSTVALHAVGIAIGFWSGQLAGSGERPVRILGSVIAAAGAAMLIF